MFLGIANIDSNNILIKGSTWDLLGVLLYLRVKNNPLLSFSLLSIFRLSLSLLLISIAIFFFLFNTFFNINAPLIFIL